MRIQVRHRVTFALIDVDAHPVPGVDSLAVHPTLGDDSTWSVTHIETGARFPDLCRSKDAAIQYARKVYFDDWLKAVMIRAVSKVRKLIADNGRGSA